MISQETKDQIEKERWVIFLNHVRKLDKDGIGILTGEFHDALGEELTKAELQKIIELLNSAEKLEEKNKEIEKLIKNHWEELNKDDIKFKAQLESKDRELAQLKEEYQTFKAGIAKGDALYVNLSWDGELSPHQKLKEIAEKMNKTLKGLGGIEAWINDRQVKEHFQETVYPALTAYTEWCKQNVK